MKKSNPPFVVTLSGFICIDVWLASRESRKIISPRIILVQLISVLKSGRKMWTSLNNKGVVLLFGRILSFDILMWQ